MAPPDRMHALSCIKPETLNTLAECASQQDNGYNASLCNFTFVERLQPGCSWWDNFAAVAERKNIGADNPKTQAYINAYDKLIAGGIEDPTQYEIRTYLAYQYFYNNASPAFQAKLKDIAFDLDETLINSERSWTTFFNANSYVQFFEGVPALLVAMKDTHGEPPILYTQQTNEYFFEIVKAYPFLAQLYFEKNPSQVQLVDVQYRRRIITMDDNVTAREKLKDLDVFWQNYPKGLEEDLVAVKKFLHTFHDPTDVPPKFACLAELIDHNRPQILVENHERTAALVHTVEGLPVIYVDIKPDDNFSARKKTTLQKLQNEPFVSGLDFIKALKELEQSNTPFVQLKAQKKHHVPQPIATIDHKAKTAVELLWERHTSNKENDRLNTDATTATHRQSLRISAFGAAALGTPNAPVRLAVNIKSDLKRKEDEKDPSKNNIWVNFYASLKDQSSSPVFIGSAVTNNLGVATLELNSFEEGNYEITYTVPGLEAPVEIKTKGSLTIRKPRPTIAVSWDVLAKGQTSAGSYVIDASIQNALHLLAQDYDLIYLAPEQDETDREGLESLIAANNLPSSTVYTGDQGIRLPQIYSRLVPRDLECQTTELIKYLRAYQQLPIVAGLGWGNTDVSSFDRAGIKGIIVPRDDDWSTFFRRMSDYKDDFRKEADRILAPLPADPEALFQRRIDLLVPQSRILTGGEATLHIDPADAYNNLMRTLESAEKSIYIEVFSITPDDVGDKIIEILIQKAHAGVDVKLIIDLRGSAFPGLNPWSDNAIRTLRNAGVKVRVYEFRDLREIALSDHIKLTVVDNTIALISGRNFTKKYFRPPGTGHKKDGIHDVTAVTGPPLAREYAKIFFEAWQQVTADTAENNSHASDWGSFNAPPNTHIQWPWAGNVPIEGSRLIKQSPGEDTNIEDVLVAMFNNQDPRSKKVIFETDFVISERVAEALYHALAREAKKPISLRRKFTMIVGTADPITNFIRTPEWRDLMNAGLTIVQIPENTHAKIATDGVHVLVGSWNPDGQTYRDYELSALLWGDEIVKAFMTKFFEPDLQKAQKITLNSLEDNDSIWKMIADYLGFAM